jgi:hypothetical protein
MRKLILSLVFLLSVGGTLMNAKASNDEILSTSKEAIAVVEDFGCARDCVNSAIEGSKNNAYAMMRVSRINAYHTLYEKCYYSNCE